MFGKKLAKIAWPHSFTWAKALLIPSDTRNTLGHASLA